MGAKRGASSPSRATKWRRGSMSEGAKRGSAIKIDKRWQAAAELLAETSKDIPVSCLEMLRSAIPHALSTPKEERHRFQSSLISAVSQLQATEEENRRTAVSVCESEVVAHKVAREDATNEIETATADENAKREEKRVKSEGITQQQKAVEAVNVRLAAEREEVISAQAAVQLADEKRKDYQLKYDSQWAALKAASFDKKDWRSRNKAIDSMVNFLCEAGSPESLTATLPVVLKTGNPEVRADFAKASIEHAEVTLTGYIATLAARVEELEGVLTERKKGVDDLEKELKEAQDKLDAAMQTAIDAENEWADANNKVFQLQQTIAGFAHKEAELDEALQAARKSLESFRGLADKFDKMVEGTSAAEAGEAVCEGSAAVTDQQPAAQTP